MNLSKFFFPPSPPLLPPLFFRRILHKDSLFEWYRGLCVERGVNYVPHIWGFFLAVSLRTKYISLS